MDFKDFTVSEVPFAYYKKCAVDFSLTMTSRPSNGLTLILEGELDVVYPDRAYRARRGDIILQRKGDSYELRGCGKTAVEYIVISYVSEPSDVLDEVTGDARVFRPKHTSRWRDAFERAARAYLSAGVCHVPRLRAAVQTLLCDIVCECYPDVLSSEENPVSAAYYYMEEFFYLPLTAEDIARVAGVSSSYLRTLFHRVFGTSPMRCLNRIRIERAKVMLASGLFSMSEVATACGFQNVYYFSRVFKELTGSTPGKY